MAYIKNLVIEDGQIRWTNFSGSEGTYNRAGDRNFLAVIPDDMVEGLVADGWNVKTVRDKATDEVLYNYIKVSVKYGDYPPKVYLVTKHKKILLDEETVGQLDSTDLESVDMEIRPYHWSVNGKEGVKAYLQTMYAVVKEDRFADKYEDEPF